MDINYDLEDKLVWKLVQSYLALTINVYSGGKEICDIKQGRPKTS